MKTQKEILERLSKIGINPPVTVVERARCQAFKDALIWVLEEPQSSASLPSSEVNPEQ